MDVLLALTFIAILVGIYFLPLLVAWKRRHRNAVAIAVLNLFLGWTFLGWVAALVWAFTDNVDTPRATYLSSEFPRR
jgi:Superinfection immunity protein